MPPTPTPIQFPFKGLHKGSSYSQQPPGTTPDCLNVRPWDTSKGRLRGGQRPGLGKYLSPQVNGLRPVQNLTLSVSTLLATDAYLGYCAVGLSRQGFLRDADGDAIDNLSWGATGVGGPPGNQVLMAMRSNGDLFFGGGTTGSGATYPYTTIGCLQADGSTVRWTKQLADEADTTSYLEGVSWNAVQDRLAVVTSRNDDWDGATAGQYASVFLLDPLTGAILWRYDIGELDNTRYPGNVFLDDDGSIYVTSVDTDWWGGTDTAHAVSAVFKLTPDVDAGTTTVEWAVRPAAVSSIRLAVNADELVVEAGGVLYFLNKMTGATLTTKDTTYVTHYDLAFFSNGDVAVAAAVGGTDRELIRYNRTTLAETWDWLYSSGTNAMSRIVIDYADNVYISGFKTTTAEDGTGGSMNFFKVTGGGTFVWEQLPIDANFANAKPAVFPPETTAARRSIDLFAVSGGSIYTVTPASAGAVSGGVGVLLGGTSPIMSTTAFQDVYWVDGTNAVFYDTSAGTVKDWAAESTVDAGLGFPTGCSIICLYRGRAVLAGTTTDPHNWFMSASGNPLDWDYFPATTSATMAVAGSSTDAGKSGDIITALVPYSDDILIIGGDHTLSMMSGDPAAGGSIDIISYEIGITGPFAATFDSYGILWFVGYQGLFRMAPGGKPELVSRNRLDSIFRAINYETHRVILMWDRDRDGLNIFITPVEEGSTFHYFYDARTESFWREQWPAAAGPLSVVMYDADDPSDRTLLAGGHDGHIRKYDDTAASDADTSEPAAIDSYVRIPLPPTTPSRTVRLSRIAATIAAGSDDVDLNLYVGNTPEEAATTTTVRYTSALSAGRNPRTIQRAAENALMLELSNDTAAETWYGLEGCEVWLDDMGEHKGP